MPSLKKNFLYLSSTVLFLANPALGSELSYTSIGIGLIGGSVELDSASDDVDYSGATLSGSFAVNDTVFITGSSTALETDDTYGGDEIEQSMITLGGGAHFALNRNADFVMAVGYTTGEEEWGPFEVDIDGFVFAAGIRGKPSEVVELSAFINHAELDYEADGGAEASDSETGFSVEARYFFTAPFSLGLGFSSGDDDDAAILSFRYDFNND